MEILAHSNEVTPMPWEGDVVAGDSGSPSCAKTQLCSAESRSSVDCALRLTSAAGLAGLVPSESLAP